MFPNRCLFAGLATITCGLLVAIGLLNSQAKTDAQTKAVGKNPTVTRMHITAPYGLSLSTQARKNAVAALNSELRINPRTSSVRILRVIPALDEAKQGKTGGSFVNGVTVDYATGKAMRFTLNAANGKIVRREMLAGRPQSTATERTAAANIIRADKQYGPMVQKGVLEGGFVVDPPATVTGAARNHRIVKMDLLSPDRRRFQQIFYVDLHTGRIAAVAKPK